MLQNLARLLNSIWQYYLYNVIVTVIVIVTVAAACVTVNAIVFQCS